MFTWAAHGMPLTADEDDLRARSASGDRPKQIRNPPCAIIASAYSGSVDSEWAKRRRRERAGPNGPRPRCAAADACGGGRGHDGEERSSLGRQGCRA